MKKCLMFSLALVMGSGIASAKGLDPEGEYYVPETWCSIGTSITWYNNHVNGFTKGYQTRVMDHIKFKEFTNVGVSGGCANSAFNRMVKADLYTIEHGINDWGNRVPPATFEANVRKIIAQCREKNPKCKIVLCTPRKAYGFGNYLPAASDMKQTNGGYYLKDYVERVVKIARDERLPLVDFYSTCGENDELASLSIDVALHPNDAGYERMAKEMTKVLLAKVYPKAMELKDYPMTFTDDGKPKDVEVKKFISSSDQVVLKGTDIAKMRLASAKIGGSWVPGGPFDGKVFFEKRDAKAKTYTCQVQSCSPQDACMRIVALEFRQEFTGDVVAKVLWNRYKFQCNAYGTDFSVAGAYDGACGSADNYACQGYVIGDMTLSVNK